MVKRKRKTDKSKLIKKYLEHRPASDYVSVLRKRDRGRGIYVLFNGKKVYYVGLSKTSLYRQIRNHATKDRHKNKWRRFSFYQIGRTRFIKDIESLLIRVCKPPGNKVTGKFKRNYDLSKRLSVD